MSLSSDGSRNGSSVLIYELELHQKPHLNSGINILIFELELC